MPCGDPAPHYDVTDLFLLHPFILLLATKQDKATKPCKPVLNLSIISLCISRAIQWKNSSTEIYVCLPWMLFIKRYKVSSLTNGVESSLMFVSLRTAVGQHLRLSCRVDVLPCLLHRRSVSVYVCLCDLLLCCKLPRRDTVNYSTLVTPTRRVVFQRCHGSFEFQGPRLIVWTQEELLPIVGIMKLMGHRERYRDMSYIYVSNNLSFWCILSVSFLSFFFNSSCFLMASSMVHYEWPKMGKCGCEFCRRKEAHFRSQPQLVS